MIFPSDAPSALDYDREMTLLWDAIRSLTERVRRLEAALGAAQ